MIAPPIIKQPIMKMKIVNGKIGKKKIVKEKIGNGKIVKKKIGNENTSLAICGDVGPTERSTTLDPPQHQFLERLPLWTVALWAGGPAAVIVAAALLRPGQGRQVVFPWIDFPVPETCAMYARFGVDCPGCGLTRGFIHVADANFMTAWEINPISWPLFLYTAMQIPIALAHSLRKRPTWLSRLDVFNQWTFVAIMTTLMIRWVARVVWGV